MNVLIKWICWITCLCLMSLVNYTWVFIWLLFLLNIHLDFYLHSCIYMSTLFLCRTINKLCYWHITEFCRAIISDHPFKIKCETSAHVHKISCEEGGASVTNQEEIHTRACFFLRVSSELTFHFARSACFLLRACSRARTHTWLCDPNYAKHVSTHTYVAMWR